MAAAKHEELAELRETVERLEQRLQVLIQALDELAEEIQWRNRQQDHAASRREPFVLTSMPLDPCAGNWAVNRVPPEQVAALRDQVVRKPASPGRLFD
jgi:hypothetical protein